MTLKLTALKLTRAAVAFTDGRKRVPRKRREEGRSRRRLSSHKSGKSESRDDFEMHVACFVCKTEYWEVKTVWMKIVQRP